MEELTSAVCSDAAADVQLPLGELFLRELFGRVVSIWLLHGFLLLLQNHLNVARAIHMSCCVKTWTHAINIRGGAGRSC